MVLGQLFGMATAAPTGELSGAGFGPNYTILMKLGYEFYAPRILDEMQKNPQKSFEDTQYWRLFQTHLKSYTDAKLQTAIDGLLSLPQTTLDAIVDKFGEIFGGGPTPTSGIGGGSHTLNIRLDQGQALRLDPSREQGLSPHDQDILRQKEREEAKQTVAKAKTNKELIDDYIRAHPSPTSDKNSKGEKCLGKARGNINSPASIVVGGSCNVAFNGFKRHRTQSTDLNLNLMRAKLTYLAGVLHHERNSKNPNVTVAKAAWDYMNRIAQFILSWQTMYT